MVDVSASYESLLQRDVRRASLSVGVTLQAETWVLPRVTVRAGKNVLVGGSERDLSLTYWGTIDALLAAGCLTRDMLPNRPPRQRQGRTQRDEHGIRFILKRAPTKALPERMRLTREGGPAFAMQLPGVREMFPEGIPEPAQAEPTPTRQRPFLRIVVNNEFAGGCTP